MDLRRPAVRCRVLCVLAAALALLFVLAATAYASGPPEPVLGLTDLQKKIDEAPGNVVEGYMKTVLRGTKIETIPVDVLAVTSPESVWIGPGMPTSFILFEAKGPVIDRIGGIAAGMSGSPIYVPDGGEDKIVGALSYGDAFTLNGTGLATPIESMVLVQSYGAATSLAASKPVTRVTVGVAPSARGEVDGRSTFTGKSLSAMMVGGMRSGDPLLKRITDRLKARGVDVIAPLVPLGSGDPSEEATLEGGASMAALAVRGDFWIGGIGTITYVDGSDVVAFGHPLLYSGDSALFMNNAHIDGIWPSSYGAYKLGAPTAVRGTLVQDRGAGVLGVTTPPAEEVTVSSAATCTDTGRSASTASYLPLQFTKTDPYFASDVIPAAASIAGSRAFDTEMHSGSGHTTTTVTIRDGAQTWTVCRTNVVDDDMDITTRLVDDVMFLTYSVEGLSGSGSDPELLSVDLQSDVTTARNYARIVDVKAPNGLTWGANPLQISLQRYGIAATQTLDVTLTIPAGTPLTGMLDVSALDAGDGPPDGYYSESSSGPSVASATTTEAVADLQSAPANNDIVITYVPDRMSSGPLPAVIGLRLPTDPVEMKVSTPWYMRDYVTKRTSKIFAEYSATTVNYNGRVFIDGYVDGPYEPGQVVITGRYPGDTTDRLLARASFDPREDGTFAAIVGPLPKHTKVKVSFAGDYDTLGSAVSKQIYVRADISMKASATRVSPGTNVAFTSAVKPGGCTGNVIYEYWNGSRWVSLGTKSLDSTTKSVLWWKVPRGRWSVRSRYLGGPTNWGQTSNTIVMTSS